MARASVLIFPLIALSSVACGRDLQQRVPSYPRLAPSEARVLHAHFTPAEGVLSVALPCGQVERPGNGLDDDCDGAVDGHGDKGPYLALAHTAQIGVEVTLIRSADGRVVGELSSPAVAECGARAKKALPSLELEPGSYTISARRIVSCGRDGPASLGISVGSGHERAVYATAELGDSPRALGKLEVVDTASSR
jgi:hypothetical protein